MRRFLRWLPCLVASLVAFACFGLAACHSLLGDPGTGRPPVLDAANELARATGSPIALALVGVANALYAAWQARRAVTANEAKEWTPEEAAALLRAVPPDALAAVLRAAGLKVERAG